MNIKNKKETDIYELLYDDTLYELYIDNIHYENFIIFTDNFGINYRIFINNELIGHDIDFFIDTANEQNKLILLAYEKDLPALILLETNDESQNDYNDYVLRNVSETRRRTEVLATENISTDDIDVEVETNDSYEILNYDFISLKYDNINDVYICEETNQIYKIFSKEKNKLKSIVRHYKIIKKRIWNTKDSYKTHQLNQNPQDFTNNLYNDDGYITRNNYKNNDLYFSKYYNLEQLKNQIHNDKSIATYNYLHKITRDFSDNTEYINEINTCINNYNGTNYLYIRFAPKYEEKEEKIKRALEIRNIYTEYDDIVIINKYVNENGMPIFNDDLIYSANKCNIAINKFNEKFNTNITYEYSTKK